MTSQTNYTNNFTDTMGNLDKIIEGIIAMQIVIVIVIAILIFCIISTAIDTNRIKKEIERMNSNQIEKNNEFEMIMNSNNLCLQKILSHNKKNEQFNLELLELLQKIAKDNK